MIVLIDYFDKNLAIMRVEDWPYFERVREVNRNSGRGREEVDRIAKEIKAIIAEKGAVSSKDLDFHGGKLHSQGLRACTSKLVMKSAGFVPAGKCSTMLR